MPAPVDHEARRRQVGAIAAELLAERGPDALTFRDIARRAGYSTMIVSHYFESKHHLLFHMFQAAARHGVDRMRRAIADGKAAEDCIAVLMPLDQQSRTDWHVVLAFWGKATADAAFAKEQRFRGRESLELVAQQLARLDPALIDAELLDVRARMVLSTVVGVATQAVFNPRDWSAKRQRAVLHDALRGMIPEG